MKSVSALALIGLVARMSIAQSGTYNPCSVDVVPLTPSQIQEIGSVQTCVESVKAPARCCPWGVTGWVLSLGEPRVTSRSSSERLEHNESWSNEYTGELIPCSEPCIPPIPVAKKFVTETEFEVKVCSTVTGTLQQQLEASSGDLIELLTIEVGGSLTGTLQTSASPCVSYKRKSVEETQVGTPTSPLMVACGRKITLRIVVREVVASGNQDYGVIVSYAATCGHTPFSRSNYCKMGTLTGNAKDETIRENRLIWEVLRPSCCIVCD